MRLKGVLPRLYYEMSRLELALRVIAVIAGTIFLGLLWLHTFAFMESEADFSLWLQETVARIEMWRQINGHEHQH